VILVRWQGDVYAFNLACPHENTALKWRQDDGRFQCPWHNSKYTPEGVFMKGRATRNMDRFAISRDGAGVVVDSNKLWRSDENTAEWNGAFVKV
jgi:Rieske Fe-S protein